MTSTLENIIGQAIPLKPEAPPPVTFEPLNKAQQIAANMAVYFENPYAMIEDGLIWTHDEVDSLNPVKQFPQTPYAKTISSIWLKESLIALYKSRRMMQTWLFTFLHLWIAMFREGAAIYFISDKEEKSDELVRRAAFIFNHIPDDMMLKPAHKLSYCYLDFPGLNSFIMGVPQGADQLRQYGASAILADEIAFWEKGRETFMAMKPTADGGGKITLISSPKDGFFKEICFDAIR